MNNGIVHCVKCIFKINKKLREQSDDLTNNITHRNKYSLEGQKQSSLTFDSFQQHTFFRIRLSSMNFCGDCRFLLRCINLTFLSDGFTSEYKR